MKTIAIIEDDQTIGNLLEEVLRQEGYEVRRAYSGTEAVYLLQQEKPDLALLDLMLSGLSGEQVLPSLSGIPTIVVSAKVGVDDKVRLLLNGAADYLTKPFELPELLARIQVQLRNPQGPLSPIGDLNVSLNGAGTITFQNAAPGLDQVTAGRLFHRFYTVESGSLSTGLGLSIAQDLTQRMGGKIGVVFQGENLTIWVSFPQSQREELPQVFLFRNE